MISQTQITISAVDWSTRSMTIEWFDNFAVRLHSTCANDGSFADLFVDHADDILDCNTEKCYENKDALVREVGDAFKLLSGFEAYFDLMVWSKKQALVHCTYIHTGINGRVWVFRPIVMAKLNDQQQISHWIYTADQSQVDEADIFWTELNNLNEIKNEI